MTDHSTAEKNALKLVWPESRQLLCHFHVAQAEWRWLMSVKNAIPGDIRQTYMKFFKKVSTYLTCRLALLKIRKKILI